MEYEKNEKTDDYVMGEANVEASISDLTMEADVTVSDLGSVCCDRFSITGYELGFNDIAIIVAGYMVPEHAIANMMCRVFEWNFDAQADSLISSQKYGSLCEDSPSRFSSMPGACDRHPDVSIAANNVLISSFPSLCASDQSNRFTCPFPNALYTGTLVWGVVGPKRVFGELYPMLKWSFYIDVCIGAPVYYIPGYNLSYFTPGFEVSFIFMYYIRRHYLMWWTRYNFVLSAALSAGVALCAILVFVSLQVTNLELMVVRARLRHGRLPKAKPLDQKLGSEFGILCQERTYIELGERSIM
ncbi:OPT oligopeptide transporter protein-domain-containing protein [Lipomyces doorenjongii]|uniref:OPT oligopeptide transporter protein-domain-containing protein n=1 Tax=Lipomyces doorenjongii TaxID=383834 RepID=UPI0034CEB0CA